MNGWKSCRDIDMVSVVRWGFREALFRLPARASGPQPSTLAFRVSQSITGFGLAPAGRHIFTFSVILDPPVFRNGITGLAHPFCIPTQFFHRFCQEVLRGVRGWMSKRLEQASGRENRNFVRRKAKQSRRLFCCRAGGQIHQVQKSFHLLIHSSLLSANPAVDGLRDFLPDRLLISRCASMCAFRHRSIIWVIPPVVRLPSMFTIERAEVVPES